MFVVCHMLTSLDGKIDGDFFGMAETAPALIAFLGVLVKAVIVPILRVEAGGADCAKGENNRHRGFRRVAIGIQHGKGMPGRAARHGQLVDGITLRLGGFDHLGNGCLDLVGLCKDAGVVALCSQRIVDATGNIALAAQPGKHLSVAALVSVVKPPAWR